jgi:GNAT superfamily N-acetyltransferase
MAARLSVSDRIDDTLVAGIKDGLAASDPDLGPYSPAPLAVLLHDLSGEGEPAALIGGSNRRKRIWVGPAHRGAGHGRRLLGTAEAEGRRRGCHRARLSTFSFQAAGFCERCGWRQVLALEDFPRGHRRLFYVRSL